MPNSSSFGYYQRIEQSIQLSPDAQLVTQVRIFNKVAEPKVRQDDIHHKVRSIKDVQQKTQQPQTQIDSLIVANTVIGGDLISAADCA